MMNKEEVYKQLAEGERIVLECKKAETKVPNSIWASYSAFANTYGGLILLGVYEDMEEQDRSKRFMITGVSDASKLRIDFWNMLNNKEKVNINLLRDDDVNIVEIEGKEIIAIYVPQARYDARPVYINGNWMTGTYKRNHEGDYHVSDLELKMILRDANDTGNDGMRLSEYGMKHIDEKTLNGYRQMFVLKKPDHPLNTEDDKEFLRVLGGYYVEEETGEEGLTLANPGLLKLPLPTIYKGGESRSRNPRMQTMMVGYGENIGTGFATIVKTWDSVHWMQPQLKEDTELMKVELTLYQKRQNVTDNEHKNVSDRNKNVKVCACEAKITARQQFILGLIKLKPTTTLKEMSVTLSVTERTISRDLAKL